jgi:hypothetical protein
MYSDNKTMAFRMPVHREILKVARRKSATPYRWMKILADMMTRDNGQKYCSKRNAKNIIFLAEEYSIPLDGPILAEITTALLEKTYNQSRLLSLLIKLQEIKKTHYILYVIKLRQSSLNIINRYINSGRCYISNLIIRGIYSFGKLLIYLGTIIINVVNQNK